MRKQASQATKESRRPDVYQFVTDRILAALEAGVIPWRKPWNAQYGLPRNYTTGRPYSGINAFLLHVAGGEGAPFFLTFNQAKELGGSIRKGAKGLPIIYFNVLEKGEAQPDQPTEGAKQERIAFIRYYTVFNVADVEGVEIKLPELNPTQPEPAPLTAGETIISGWQQRPYLMLGARSAAYSPATDCVKMPPLKVFQSAEEYYCTLFHELVHATGHPKRLNRPELAAGAFGSASYGREELTAEMGAAFLCAHAGFNPAATLPNSAAYLASWLDTIRGDKKLVVQAAARAQKAAELILGPVPEEPTPTPEPTQPEPEPDPTTAAPAAALPAPEPEPETATPAPERGRDTAPPVHPQPTPPPTAAQLARSRAALRHLADHPALTSDDHAAALADLAAAITPAALRRWQRVVLHVTSTWEENRLAEEARENPYLTQLETTGC